MNKFLVVFLMPLCLGSPLEGFGDATDAEIAEIRGGTYLEGFDENPQYNFNYKVADDLEQTYIARDEARNGENVRGSYSYVDPLGSLITVTYTAGAEGYQETREIQENFVTIIQRPVNRASVSVDASVNSRLEFQRAETARLQAQRAESARLQAQRVEAARQQTERAEAARLEAQRLEASRLEAQRAQAAQLEVQRAEATRLEAQRAQAARLESQRTESSRIASSQQNRADLVAQIVSQISSQVPSIIASTVSGSRGQVSGNSRGQFSSSVSGSNRGQLSGSLSGGNRAVQGQQTSASSTVTDRFGSSGTHTVILNTPHAQISYGS